MISFFLMLSLSISSLSGHPRAKRSSSYNGAIDEGEAEELCRTVKSLEQSLKSALVDRDVPLCLDSKPESKCFIHMRLLLCLNLIFSGMYTCVTRDFEEVSNWSQG